MESFGRRVARLRTGLGWTQQRLAERVGISRVGLSHIEAALTFPNERTATLLAATFDLEPHQLVDGTNYPEPKTVRLPLVAARHTEVEHALALLERDERWLVRLEELGVDPPVAEGERRAVRAGWRRRLDELAPSVLDPDQARLLGAARRRLHTR